jgi:hypothetical protein
MSDLSERKIKLMKAIADLNSDAAVEAFENLLARIQERNPALMPYVKPMRKKTDLEQLKKEQNWKPIDRAEWDEMVKSIHIKEPIEELLAMLTP